jgi:hypothetical protein
MNPVVKAQLKEFSESNSSVKLSASEFFEVFSIHAVENGILTENIDPFAAHLTGSEFGIDGISIIVQGELCTDTDKVAEVFSTGKNHHVEFHFFQSKTSESVDYGDLSKFLDAVHDFFVSGTLAVSDQVNDLRAVKDDVYAAASKENPTLRCYYCFTGSGEISTPIAKLIESNKSRLDSLSLFSDIEIQIVGAKQIQYGYRSATNAITETIEFPRSLTLPEHSSVDEAFIGFISADQIVRLATQEVDGSPDRTINRSVFYDNIRDFNPDSEINKSILAELMAGEDSSFIFKNNGITVVARDITRKGDNFIVNDYQIVNGCQTTNILISAKENLKNVTVPLRLIASKDADFVSSIIIGTNKQNEVKEDQFWALSSFMKDLEVYCASQHRDEIILIERRENQYRDTQVERTRIFKPADLMKAIAAMYLFQPNRAARDYRGIRKEFSNRVFQTGHSVELYHLAALSSYKFDFAIRNSRIDRSRGIYKYYALFGAIRKHWKTSNILDAPPKSQKVVIENLRGLVSNEDAFVMHIEETAAILDRLIDDAKLSSREQIRDFIRTESVVELFARKLPMA